MADSELWGPDFALIGAPAATDRMPVATSPGAGGYSERREFVYRDATGAFNAKSSGEIVRLETTTARGSGSCYQSFRDPTGGKGVIGYYPGADDMYVWNSLGPVYFATNNAIRWAINSTAFIPNADNSYAFGGSGNRCTVIYAATGTINTSDEREKSWREMLGVEAALYAPNLYEAELRAGLRACDELGFFQWNDAIVAKGADEARWHFGPRAQRVWAIFADEGLCDALVEDVDTGDLLPPEGSIPPAFLCFDEWGEETAPVMEDVEIPAVLDDEGNEIEPARTEQQPTGETYVSRPAGNRFGVRIDQLHSLMIAALNAERLKQEATIADLVARVVALEPAP